MIDEKLLALATETGRRLDAMTDARPSELATTRRKFATQFDRLLREATDDVTVDQKVAFFDAMARSHVAELREEVGARFAQNHCDESDNRHYTWENVRIGVLGPKAFQATNMLEGIFRIGSRRH